MKWQTGTWLKASKDIAGVEINLRKSETITFCATLPLNCWCWLSFTPREQQQAAVVECLLNAKQRRSWLSTLLWEQRGGGDFSLTIHRQHHRWWLEPTERVDWIRASHWNVKKAAEKPLMNDERCKREIIFCHLNGRTWLRTRRPHRWRGNETTERFFFNDKICMRIGKYWKSWRVLRSIRCGWSTAQWT